MCSVCSSTEDRMYWGELSWYACSVTTLSPSIIHFFWPSGVRQTFDSILSTHFDALKNKLLHSVSNFQFDLLYTKGSTSDTGKTIDEERACLITLLVSQLVNKNKLHWVHIHNSHFWVSYEGQWMNLSIGHKEEKNSKAENLGSSVSYKSINQSIRKFHFLNFLGCLKLKLEIFISQILRRGRMHYYLTS